MSGRITGARFDLVIHVSEREEHWVAKLPDFGITVYANTQQEAEARASKAVDLLGNQLQREYGFEGALEFLNDRRIKHVVLSEPTDVLPSQPKSFRVQREVEFEAVI